MEQKQIIKIKDENNIEHDATLVATFEMDATEYAIYTLGSDDANVSNLYTAELIKGDNNIVELKTIEDEKIKLKITSMVADIINK